jgi:hypothetical protein
MSLTGSGWVNRSQQDVVEYLQEENRVLRERLGGRRLLLTDATWVYTRIRGALYNLVMAHHANRGFVSLRLVPLVDDSVLPRSSTPQSEFPSGSGARSPCASGEIRLSRYADLADRSTDGIRARLRPG